MGMGMVHENSKEASDFLNQPTTTSTSKVMMRYRKNPETGKMEMETIDYDQYLGVDPSLPHFMKEPLIEEAEAKLKKERRQGKTTTPSASSGKQPRKYRKNKATGMLEEVASDEDLSKTAQTTTPFPIPSGQRKYRKNAQTGKMEEVPPNEEL